MTGDSLKTERNINKRINLFYPLPVNRFFHFPLSIFPFPFSILPSSSLLRPERLGRHARMLLEKRPKKDWSGKRYFSAISLSDKSVDCSATFSSSIRKLSMKLLAVVCPISLVMQER